MTMATSPYDTADYLENEEAITMYAEEALADADPHTIGQFVRVIVRARGLNALAASSGIPRRALVEALSGEDPNGFGTLEAALRATSAGATYQAAE